MSRLIWTVKEPIVSLEGIEEFGRVCVAYPKTIRPWDVTDQMSILNQDVFPVSSKSDFVITMGPNIMVALFVNTWLRKYDKINFLRYDSKKKKYFPRVFIPPKFSGYAQG